MEIILFFLGKLGEYRNIMYFFIWSHVLRNVHQVL